jgi:hypothetical protein
MFRLLRLFSLVLLALSLAAWIRSYRFAEGIEVTMPRGSFLLTSHPGRVRICWPAPVFVQSTGYGLNASSSPRFGPQWTAGRRDDGDTASRAIFWRETDSAGKQTRFVQIPLWALTLLTGIHPVLVFAGKIRRSWRLRSGALCRVCEYDLRGISDRCPECGTSVKPAPFRRRRGRRLLVGAGAVCLILAGGWFALHDFRSTRCLNMDFATLGGFTLDQNKGKLADIPQSIRQLDGQRIAIDGYMIPMDVEENITEFALVPTLDRPDPSPPPPAQQTIVARIVTGQVSAYYPDQIRVCGILHVRITQDDGDLVSIFEMTVESIQPAPK